MTDLLYSGAHETTTIFVIYLTIFVKQHYVTILCFKLSMVRQTSHLQNGE